MRSSARSSPANWRCRRRRRTRCPPTACAGSTSSASSSNATAMSRRRRAGSRCTAAPCSAFSASTRRATRPRRGIIGSCLQEAQLAPFEDEAGEPAAGEGAGIDADAVALHLRPRRDGVPVHDDHAEILLGEQEVVADPQQVLRGLLVERHAGPHPGMGEEIVALPVGERQALHEAAMALRQPLRQVALGACQLARVHRHVGRAHAIAAQGLGATVKQPGRPDGGIFEEAQQALLMIALEVNALEARQRLVEQQVDHRRRLVAAIDIVAEIDHHIARRLAAVGILMDEPMQLAQQVGTAVDVADGVNAAVRRRLWHHRLAVRDPAPRTTGVHGRKYGAGRPIAPQPCGATRSRPGGFACQIRPIGPKRTGMSETDLLPLVEALAQSRVLCVGDVMLDHYVYGSVERVSPEAPIPVLRVEREQKTLGGAGNVVRNLHALGLAPCFVSVTGNDAAGREVGQLVARLGGTEAHVLTDRGRTTTLKTRYVAGTQQMLRADREQAAPLAGTLREDFLTMVRQLLPQHQVTIVSDYAKGVLAEGVAAEVIAAARAAGHAVVVDPKGIDYQAYRGATLIKPNRRELGAATNRAVDSESSIVAAARALIDECGFAAVLVSLSQDGMMLVESGGATHKLGAGAPLRDAARLANVAAGIVVGKVGTAVVHAAELIETLIDRDALATRKVLPLALALDHAARWRRNGLKLAFTNGCFDLLHPGHVALLGQARAAAD